MTISVRGIGWLTSEGYGCVRTGLRYAYQPGEGPHALPKRGLFSYPVKNFGRFDVLSKMTCGAVALALQDAALGYGPSKKQDIGIIGTNAEGSLKTDLEYFNDYIESGRTLSRGSLFIYTLPSSPLGEAAIHFGFLGPLFYAAGGKHSLALLLDTASELVLAGETPVMLAGKVEKDEAVFFVLGENPDHDRNVVCAFPEARALVETIPETAGLIGKFSLLKSRKGIV